MNGIHNLDFQLPNGGLFASVPNLKINEMNLNAMAALLASSDSCQSMLNGMEDGALTLFGSQPHNPFYSYLHQNLFANGLKTNQQSAGQQEMTPAMLLQNTGLTSGNLNGFDKIDSLNSLFKPTNGNMLGM